jgi:flagellar basal-body rod modification protein FlgD
MQVNGFTPAAATAATPQKSVIGSDFDTFLKMLTTQMKYQDPLNPIESSEYAVQLATFSGVEQQTQTNELLRDLGAQFSLLGMSELAGWVGREARVSGPVNYSGSPIELAPNPARIADRAVLVVRGEQGALVAREDLPASTAPYSWFGADAAGDPLPNGRYTLSLESWQGDQLLGESPIDSYQTIVEARGGAGGTTVVLAGGIEVRASTITALRNPQGG